MNGGGRLGSGAPLGNAAPQLGSRHSAARFNVGAACLGCSWRLPCSEGPGAAWPALPGRGAGPALLSVSGTGGLWRAASSEPCRCRLTRQEEAVVLPAGVLQKNRVFVKAMFSCLSDRLFFAILCQKPKSGAADTHYFCVDNELVYAK